MAGSGLRPLSNIPHCCLPYESGPCLSPSEADHPLRPATDRRLGEPLPHQLANRPRAPLVAPELSLSGLSPVVLCGISSPFGELSPTTRQVTHVLLTRPPLTRRSVRLACLIHSASVCPEPGSNSPKETFSSRNDWFSSLTGSRTVLFRPLSSC